MSEWWSRGVVSELSRSVVSEWSRNVSERSRV